MRRLVYTLLVAALFSCSGPKQESYVILVSFDGFRHDYVEKFDLKNFKEFVNRGASAEALIPSFPSKTFSNHYSIATGLYPGHHGIVANKFFDKEQNKLFNLHNPAMVKDSTFFSGTPLWELAQQKGLKSASIFWAGSEAPVNPTYYMEYNEEMDNDLRIDQVISWLQLPPEERPRFITLYFSLVDTQGHDFGPESTELHESVVEADRLFGALLDALKQLSLRTNVIVTSDHGMTKLKQDSSTYIVLPELIPGLDTTVRVVNSGTQASFYCDECDSVYYQLKRLEQDNGFKILRRTEFPKRWHYDTSLAGDILMIADAGKQIESSSKILEWIARQDKLSYFGAHGYDPALVKDMYGIFYAAGPDIKSGIKVPPFQNVDVYPFVAKLLKLPTPPIDGSSESTKSMLKQ